MELTADELLSLFSSVLDDIRKDPTGHVTTFKMSGVDGAILGREALERLLEKAGLFDRLVEKAGLEALQGLTAPPKRIE